MSKTDKTTPYRVWQERNPDGWNRKYTSMMYLFPRPKREQIYRAKHNARERNKTRMAIREIVKGEDGLDFQSFTHRHSALWDTW